MEALSAAEVRRIAIAAQGLAEPRPAGRIDRRHVRRVFDRVGLIQVDSVNVLVRSQELPVFARLGPHPRSILPAMARQGELFEYWGGRPTPLAPLTMKNWLPLVFGPALAIASEPISYWPRWGSSSANL